MDKYFEEFTEKELNKLKKDVLLYKTKWENKDYKFFENVINDDIPRLCFLVYLHNCKIKNIEYIDHLIDIVKNLKNIPVITSKYDVGLAFVSTQGTGTDDIFYEHYEIYDDDTTIDFEVNHERPFIMNLNIHSYYEFFQYHKKNKPHVITLTKKPTLNIDSDFIIKQAKYILDNVEDHKKFNTFLNNIVIEIVMHLFKYPIDNSELINLCIEYRIKFELKYSSIPSVPSVPSVPSSSDYYYDFDSDDFNSFNFEDDSYFINCFNKDKVHEFKKLIEIFSGIDYQKYKKIENHP